MKKRVLSIVLVLTIVFCIAPVSFAAKGLENFKKTNAYTPGMFHDVLSSDWYAESVIAAYQYGIVKGTAATNFNPKGNITVAETIVLACRIHNIYNGGTGVFTQGNPWYQVYVDYAVANKIIPWGYSNFNAKISRMNFAKIIVNALPDDALSEINNIAEGKIPDVPNDASIYKLYRAGILTGSDKYGTFNPNSTILRSEVATIVTRMADKSKRKVFIPEAKPADSKGVASANSKKENGSTATNSSTASGNYYKTPTGTKYHLDPDCGGKNSFATTNITGLKPCSKCAN